MSRKSMLAEDAASYGGDWPKEKQSDAFKAELAWGQLRSQRGWTEGTLAMIFYEFIKSKGLFAELVKFAKGRK